MGLAFSPAAIVRRALVRRVQAVFNDREKGETPVIRSPKALFEPESVIWRVHGDVTTMMIGELRPYLCKCCTHPR